MPSDTRKTARPFALGESYQEVGLAGYQGADQGYQGADQVEEEVIHFSLKLPHYSYLE